MPVMRIAVLGAGIAGLVAARTLHEAGLDVTVFDKGRGVGGRLATRRREQGAFDHGAQRFSARSEAFVAAVERWRVEGVVQATESPDGAPFWIPAPSASALPKHLAAGLTIRLSTRVTRLTRKHHAWHLSLEGASDEGPFDVVLSTAPAPQSAALLPSFEPQLSTIRYDPTWALVLACDASGPTWPETIFTECEGDLSLVVREGRKPGRLADEALVRLVVHASSAFSIAHLEADPNEVSEHLIAALKEHAGLSSIRPRYREAHRWRFARVSQPLGTPCLFDRERGIGVGGDGFLGPRIEAAFTSGLALGEAVLAR